MVDNSVIEHLAIAYDRAAFGNGQKASLVGGLAAGAGTVFGMVVSTSIGNSEAALSIFGYGAGLVSIAMLSRQLFSGCAVRTDLDGYVATEGARRKAQQHLGSMELAHG